MKKRLMIALCCLVLLVQIFPIVPMAETSDTWEVGQDLYYCRAQLATLPNGEALLFAYDNLVAGIDACAKEIEISNDKYQLTMDEFLLALESVRRDHTEQFWLSTAYSYNRDSKGNIVNMLPQYLMTGAALDAAKVAFNQAIEKMVANVTPEMSEYEKEKVLHDLLAVQVTYASSTNAHNAYGALVEGVSVCEGYAEALQCLLQRVGMQSIQVYGTSRGENHAWNMVRVDGKYYLTDLTWNDQDTNLLYAYFNQNHEIFNEDHDQWRVGTQITKQGPVELECEVFDLPVCTATEANYFTKTDANLIINNNYTVASIAQLLKKNNMSVSVFVKSDLDAFDAWFNENIIAIATAAGVSGNFSYNCITLGREVRVFIETCKHEQLSPVKAKDATCEADGNIAYYVCQNKDCGKWFSDVNAEAEIVNHNSVKVFSIGHNFTVQQAGEGTLKKKAEKCIEHDTYFLTCAVCGEVSDTYTFETDVTGEHNYAAEWQPDNYNTHKRPCLNNCGEVLHEAHTDANEDKICDVCGQKKTMQDGLENLLPDDTEVEGTVNEILDIILANPLILLGGGGSVALLVIIVIIKKIREG